MPERTDRAIISTMKNLCFLIISIFCILSVSAERVECQLCSGTGRATCQCWGRGQIYTMGLGRWVTCTECGGTGKSKKACSWCKGKGYMEPKQNSSGSSGGNYSTPSNNTCYKCSGSGNCSDCNGQGTQTGYWNSTGQKYYRTCGSCGGSGKCSHCLGKGHL